MTGTNCDLFTHNQSRSYLNHLVLYQVTLLSDTNCNYMFRLKFAIMASIEDISKFQCAECSIFKHTLQLIVWL